MPAAILPDEGLAEQLRYILSATIVGVLPWELVLWVNDITPTAATTWADLVEASWPGYHRVALSRNMWTAAEVSNGCARSTCGTVPQTWVVRSGGQPQTNYGVAYLDQSSGVLRWVQRFDSGDVRPTFPGMVLKVLPEYTLTSASCAALRNPRGSRAAERRKGIRK